MVAAFIFGLFALGNPCNVLMNTAIFPSNISSDIKLVPVTMTVDSVDYIYCVATDYYATSNNIRQPMGMSAITKLLAGTDFTLPTKELVDAIWKQADVQLKPITLKPTSLMSSNAYIVKHNELINIQLTTLFGSKLVAGIKKDVIIQRIHGKVTIYGWHQLTGIVIQPVSSAHTADYFDYSHGVRLVAKHRFRIRQ